MSVLLYTKLTSIKHVFYCWFYFKIKFELIFLFNNYFIGVPTVWLIKLSFLLKNQVYNYEKLLMKKNTYNKIISLKSIFLQFLFVCGIKPFFQRFYLLQIKNFLNECVLLFKALFFILIHKVFKQII